MVLTLGFGFVMASPGAPKTWRGNSNAGDSQNWSDPANWVEDLAPGLDDDLIFPANPNSFSSRNNLNNLRIHSIRIEGGNYTIFQNPFSLTGGITSLQGVSSISNPINLTAPQNITVQVGRITLSGALSGAGGITKLGAGQLQYRATRTISMPGILS